MHRLLSIRYPFSEVTHYTKRGKHRPPLSLKPGDMLPPFQLLTQKYYKDFDLTYLTFQNKDHGSRIHQLECQEENNTLSMIFKTPSLPKPGINEALEKLLLCGSKKYPVRNIVEQMGRRSFSMLTQPQTTDQYLMFSFNTPIMKDFKNLFDVYWSMVFDPLMREQDFYEVVRRLTYQNRSLGFTGQLAAELYSNQFNIDQTIYDLINEKLLCEKSQSNCKPLDLLNISYADLIKHYKETVTLPNCDFVIHGDMNIHYLVDQINRNQGEIKAKSHKPIFFEATRRPKEDKTTYTFQHLKQQTILMMSYKIERATEEEKVLLEILSYLLFDMPESPFLKFNTPETPYPNLYGYHQRYFNIGITFYQPEYEEQQYMETAKTFRKRQKFLVQKQKEVITCLQDIAQSKLSNKLIEKCLHHLEGNFYERKGSKIIESITQKILQGKNLDSVFEVTNFISKLFKTYRKDNIFEELLKKYIINNQDFIVLRGFHNPNVMDNENKVNQALLSHIQNSLPTQQLTELANYSSPNMLQNFELLPEINPNELQFFEDANGQPIKISNVTTTFYPRHHGNRFVFKFDLTDIGEDDIPLLALFCKVFPQMGYKSVNDKVYHALLETYISKLQMNYETVKDSNGELKIYMYLNFEFTDRNYEYAVNIINGLLMDFNYDNRTALSRALHLAASNCFNDISDDILHCHGVHLAASKSPFVFFESPLFQARTLCGLAAEMKKTYNPKGYLTSLCFKMQEIWRKMMGWSRIELLWSCHPEKKSHYRKYLNILLSQIESQSVSPGGISVDGFPQEKWQKYFPNFQNQLVFQAFAVPYRTKNSPEALVLASIINENISTFNQIGGCYLYKGALVSFVAGTRSKFLQLEDYYRKIDNIDVAKRKIFQRFDRYTVEQQFKTGIGYSQARNFKEAVLSVDKSGVQEVLNEYILKQLKEGNSSVLSLGSRIQNYDPLLKKGWEIERSIDDVSLEMESLSKQEIIFNPGRYVDIC